MRSDGDVDITFWRVCSCVGGQGRAFCGGVTRTDAEIVTVTARVEDPEPPAPVRPDEDEEIPESRDQRPTRYCGLGMLMSFFGSLVGLSAVRLSRRRLRL